MSFSSLRRKIIASGNTLLALIFVALCFIPIAAGVAAEPGIRILNPASEETIHDNTGRISVAVELGEGVVKNGQRVRILLDGAPAARDRAQLHFVLHGVVRGRHTLRALLVDAKGNTLASSEPVTFYLWQASRLIPRREK